MLREIFANLFSAYPPHSTFLHPQQAAINYLRCSSWEETQKITDAAYNRTRLTKKGLANYSNQTLLIIIKSIKYVRQILLSVISVHSSQGFYVASKIWLRSFHLGVFPNQPTSISILHHSLCSI